MAGRPQRLELSTEEDVQLRRIEQSPHIKPKVRLRASVIRLNAAGWSRRELARHTGRSYATICQDLGRWQGRGVDGLADGLASNQPEKISSPIRAFVLEKLGEERIWTCSQLTEAVKKEFGIKIGREAMRLRILQMGYCWKRTRYVPCKEIDAKVEHEHKAPLETLKRGHKTNT